MSELITAVLPTTIVTKPSRKTHSFPAAYALTHQATGSVYVGSTHNLYNRINQHKTRLAAGTHRNKNIQAVFDSDPKFNLAYVQTETKEDALDIEQQLLDSLKDTVPLLNVAADARRAGAGLRLSAETKAKLSAATTEQFASEEARLKHSEMTARMWKDPTYRANHLGRVLSDDSVAKSSDSSKALWQDPSYRAKQVQARGKSVVMDGVTYPSAVAAARELKIPVSTLHDRLKKLKQTTS